MSEPNDSPHDPIEALLAGNDLAHDAASGGDADALRNAILGQTLGVIRRRRRLKRFTLAAGLLGCYAAGVVTMFFVYGSMHRDMAVASNMSLAVVEPLPAAALADKQPVAPDLTPDLAPDLTPDLADQLATVTRGGPPSPPAPTTPWCPPFTGEGSRAAQPTPQVVIPTAFESWRNIGDYYLRETGDISLAMAGYSQALDLATEQERKISPERDNWLLIALKEVRIKEKMYAFSQPN